MDQRNGAVSTGQGLGEPVITCRHATASRKSWPRAATCAYSDGRVNTLSPPQPARALAPTKCSTAQTTGTRSTDTPEAIFGTRKPDVTPARRTRTCSRCLRKSNSNENDAGPKDWRLFVNREAASRGLLNRRRGRSTKALTLGYRRVACVLRHRRTEALMGSIRRRTLRSGVVRWQVHYRDVDGGQRAARCSPRNGKRRRSCPAPTRRCRRATGSTRTRGQADVRGRRRRVESREARPATGHAEQHRLACCNDTWCPRSGRCRSGASAPTHVKSLGGSHARRRRRCRDRPQGVQRVRADHTRSRWRTSGWLASRSRRTDRRHRRARRMRALSLAEVQRTRRSDRTVNTGRSCWLRQPRYALERTGRLASRAREPAA